MTNLAYDIGEEQETARSDVSAMQALRPIPRISIQAFCETEGVAQPIERAGDDRRMAKAHLKVHMGGVATAIELYETAPTPNLLILETLDGATRHHAGAGNPLAEVCDPSTKVVIVGRYNDIPLYRELIRSGVSEYVVAPISMIDVVSVISTIFVDPDADPLGRSRSPSSAPRAVAARRRSRTIAPSTMSNAVQDGGHRRRSRPRLRHRQYQLRPGSGAGHRRGGLFAGSHRRGLSRPPAGAVLRASLAACRPLHARPRLRFRRRIVRSRSSTRRSAPRRSRCSTCRTPGRNGRVRCCPRRTRWSSPRRRSSPTCATRRTCSIC
jgi:DNA-binding NarL/FixJ family response regulator